MRRLEDFLLPALYVLAAAMGYHASVTDSDPYTALTVFLAVFVSIVAAQHLPLETRKGSALESLLRTGMTTSVLEEEKVRTILRIAVTVLTGIIAYSIARAILEWSPSLMAIGLFVTGGTIAVMATFLARGRIVVEQRRTSTEAELPFLMIVMYALSSVGLTLFDMVRVVSSFFSLPSWAREMRLIRKIMDMWNLSLYSATALVIQYHPSRLVREVLERILYAARTTGEISWVVKKIFDAKIQSYMKKLEATESRAAATVTFLFFAVFMVGVAVITLSFSMPREMGHLFGVGGVFGIGSLAVIMTAVIGHTLFPKEGVLIIPRITAAMITASFASSLALVALLSASLITGITIIPLPPYAITALSTAIIAPSAIWIMKEEHRYRVETRLVNVVIDAMESAETMGTNAFTSLRRRVAELGDKKLHGFVSQLEAAQYNKHLMKRLVSSARTMITRTYLELLTHMISRGVPPKVMAEVSSMYSKILYLRDRVAARATAMGLLMTGLTAVIHGLAAWLYHVMHAVSTSISASVPISRNIPFSEFLRDPTVLNAMLETSAATAVVSALMMLALGKLRGGNFASSAPLLMIYFIVMTVMFILVPV